MFTVRAEALPQKKRALRGRRLVVIDIENVIGGAVVTQAMAAWARAVIVSAIDVLEHEQVVIATSHVGLFHTKHAWPVARVLARSGQDGADLELMDVLETEQLDRRFDEIVLVSGDGIFAEIVGRLGGLGVDVTVVSWADCLSSRLRLAAKCAVLLDKSIPNVQMGTA